MTRRSVLIALLAFVLALPPWRSRRPPTSPGSGSRTWRRAIRRWAAAARRAPERDDHPDGDDFTIERETPNGVMKTVYKLDGSESVNAMGRGGDVKSKSAWKAASSSPSTRARWAKRRSKSRNAQPRG